MAPVSDSHRTLCSMNEKESEKARVDAIDDEPWKRVSSLISLQYEGHTKDVSRMKEILIQLKNDPLPIAAAAE